MNEKIKSNLNLNVASEVEDENFGKCYQIQVNNTLVSFPKCIINGAVKRQKHNLNYEQETYGQSVDLFYENQEFFARIVSQPYTSEVISFFEFLASLKSAFGYFERANERRDFPQGSELLALITRKVDLYVQSSEKSSDVEKLAFFISWM